MSTRPSFAWSRGLALVSAACLSVGAVATYQSATAQQGAKAAPTAVHVVDLNRILASLAEATDVFARLEAENRNAQAKLDEIEGQMKSVKARLDAMPKQRSPERAQLEGQFLELSVQGRARLEVLKQLQDVSEGDAMLSLYEKITDAVKRYSEMQGIDLVLSDDSGVKLQPEAADRPILGKDVRRYSNDRQVIYAAKRVDLTDQVITMMNNEYAKGRR